MIERDGHEFDVDAAVTALASISEPDAGKVVGRDLDARITTQSPCLVDRCRHLAQSPLDGRLRGTL